MNIVRTNPHVVRQLATAVDGTPGSGPKGGTIRHFSQSGKLPESYFPYATLNDQVRVTMGFLAALRDRVGWISTGDPHAREERLGAYVAFTEGGKADQFPLSQIAPQRATCSMGWCRLTTVPYSQSSWFREIKNRCFSL